MTYIIGGRTLVRGGMVAVAVGAMALAGTAPALAAIPHVTVSPHKNLTNKQMVTVSVSKFPANTTVTIIECNASGDGDLSNCNQRGAKKAKTDSAGTAKGIAFTVVTGTVGNGTCGTSSSDRFCYVAALASTQMQATNISFR